jgi:predicted acetyltransferase
MNTHLDYGPIRDDEFDTISALLAQALFFPLEDSRSWFARLGAANFRTVRAGGRPVAGLGIIPMGHWFGGASVPAAGITAVGVAPEHRGSGVGLFMLRRMLEEVHAAGMPLASLYPATDAFYRRAGFERASTRTIYEIATAAIGIRDHALDAVPIAAEHEPEVRRLYAERARFSAGQIDRHAFTWYMLHHNERRDFKRFLVLRGDRAEGYVSFTQAGRADPLAVTDICALTPAAGRRLWTLLADHRTMVEKVRWSGAPNDGLAFLLPEQKHKADWALDLMLRVVDVAGALEARGYPPATSAELHFDVQDELLPWNNGRFVLAVADGRGSVSGGGQGRIRLHARGLAALYSGYMTAYELRAAGMLGGPEADLAAASAVFAGPRPWTPDMF